jgi:endoglucanase
MNLKPIHAVVAASVLLIACVGASQESPVFEANKRLARTVNFGNALEAPKEGDWGLTLKEGYFESIKDAGFTAIRLPVKFSAHALENAPYTLDETFMERVDWAIKNATARGLAILVDLHHYDELFENPTAHRERFVALWQQIAERYKNQPEGVMFELCNEPNGKLEPYWNDYAAQALAAVRQTNPTRAVIVGPNGWNSADRLGELKLPDDPNVIVTFHNYTPFEFTHQGAEWMKPPPAVGVTWPQTGARPRNPWQNWSWDSTITGVQADDSSALEVAYKRDYAGLYDTLRVETDQALKLRVSCLEKNPGGNAPSGVLETRPNEVVTLGFAQCNGGSAPSAVRDVIMMLEAGSPNKTASFLTLELSGPGGTVSMLTDSEGEVRGYLDRAVQYAERVNKPIFMGEFGAYNKADPESRVRWTTFTRQESEKRGIAWAYWEFGAGFGLYDPNANAWRKPLLESLIP